MLCSIYKVVFLGKKGVGIHSIICRLTVCAMLSSLFLFFFFSQPFLLLMVVCKRNEIVPIERGADGEAINEEFVCSSFLFSNIF